MARDEAISEESQPENKWDTHSQEAAYLAEGQAKLAMEIRANLDAYSSLALPSVGPDAPVVLGTLVELETAGTRKRGWYFLGPRAGGLEVTVDGTTVLVLTPQSPLGRQLIGKRLGDLVRTAGRGGSTVEQRVTSVL